MDQRLPPVDNLDLVEVQGEEAFRAYRRELPSMLLDDPPEVERCHADEALILEPEHEL